MQNTSGSNTAIVASVIVIVLIALGVWWYLSAHPSANGAAPASPTPATGQLQGTVQ